MSSNFLEIKNATFVASEKNKIDNVSLSIKEKGEIVCLLGPSCVGKTTILRTIAGLQDLKSGEINLKGKTKMARGKKYKRPGYKKAIITLKKGQNIDLTTGI